MGARASILVGLGSALHVFFSPRGADAADPTRLRLDVRAPCSDAADFGGRLAQRTPRVVAAGERDAADATVEVVARQAASGLAEGRSERPTSRRRW